MTTLEARNRRVGRLMLLLVAAMVGLGFASVPIYRIFCQATGFNGTTQRGSEADVPMATGKLMAVRFDGNVQPNVPWLFKPEKPVEKIAVGARNMAFFTATNMGSEPVTGTATFNVSPSQAGQYFTKIQCFCFTQQTLKPGETVRMPVVYYVDPKILEDPDAADIDEITLSYTFYRSEKTVEKTGAAG